MDRRVGDFKVGVELEHHKLGHNLVKFEEREHDSEIDIVREGLGVAVRLQPEHLLALDFGLEVETLNTQENLAEGLTHDHVGVEFPLQLLAVLQSFGGHLQQSMRGKTGEETHQTERVVHVSDCVYEVGITFLDDEVKGVARLGLEHSSGLGVVILPAGLAKLPFEDFEQSEFFNDVVKSQILDILLVVVGTFGALEFFVGFARVDALQNAQPPEILESES